MTPEEELEKQKGVVVVSGGHMNRAALLSILLSNGCVVIDGDRVNIADVETTSIGFPDEPCQDLSDCYDFNNGRRVAKMPPFYTQTKRDVFKNPKLKGRRR